MQLRTSACAYSRAFVFCVRWQAHECHAVSGMIMASGTALTMCLLVPGVAPSRSQGSRPTAVIRTTPLLKCEESERTIRRKPQNPERAPCRPVPRQDPPQAREKDRLGVVETLHKTNIKTIWLDRKRVGEGKGRGRGWRRWLDCVVWLLLRSHGHYCTLCPLIHTS